MMKQNFGFMLLLSVTSMYAASGDEQSTALAVIAQNPATVLKNIIHSGLIESSHEARASDMGLIYVEIDLAPNGINSLWQYPAVVAEGQEYNTDIVAKGNIQKLTAEISTLVIEQASQPKRIAALAALGLQYSLLQAKKTEKVIPGIKFPLVGTVGNTLQNNIELELSPAQRMLFRAAQLSMALNMNMQYALDPSTFDAMWHEELAVPAAADASGDNGRSAGGFNFFGPDPLCALQ